MPTRRHLLAGLGAVAAAPVLLALPATAPSARAATAQAPEPTSEAECLADLIESGEVTRADLVAR